MTPSSGPALRHGGGSSPAAPPHSRPARDRGRGTLTEVGRSADQGEKLLGRSCEGHGARLREEATVGARVSGGWRPVGRGDKARDPGTVAEESEGSREERPSGTGRGPEAAATPSLTKEAVAEAVPDAAGGVPHPAAPQAGHEGKAHAEDGHQQVAEADVDEEEVGGRAEPLELVVEHQHQQVVAQAQHADGGDEQRQQLIGAGAEEGPLARHLRLCRRGLRAARRARAVPRVHGSQLAAHSPPRPGRSGTKPLQSLPAPSRPAIEGRRRSPLRPPAHGGRVLEWLRP